MEPKKCYWMGYGNLQLEYGYEPSQELLEEVGDDVFQLDEEAIELLVHETDGEEFRHMAEGFFANRLGYTESWLVSLTRMDGLETEFIERAANAMGKAIVEKLNKRLNGHLQEAIAA